MLKTIATIRRRAGMSSAEFVQYYRDVHGEIARREKLGVARYVQNYVTDAVYGATDDAAILTGPSRDAVTELSFVDMDAMQQTFAAPYVREVVGPDGANFSDLETAISLLVREEGTSSSSASGIKAMWFLKTKSAVSGEDFDDRWRSVDAQTRDFDNVVTTCRNHRLRLPEADRAASYFGGKDVISYSGVHCVWLTGDAVVQSMHAYSRAMSSSFEGQLDMSRSFWLLVAEREIFAQTGSV